MLNKILFSFLLTTFLLAGINAFSQTTYSPRTKHDIKASATLVELPLYGGMGYSLPMTFVDSTPNTIYWSNVLDISQIDNRPTAVADTAFANTSLSVIYAYNTPGSTNDTILLTVWGLLPGVLKGSSTTGDSLMVKLGTAALVGGAPESVSATRITFTTGFKFPLIRLQWQPTNADSPSTRDGYLGLFLYNPNNDYQPPSRRWGEKP